MPSVVAPSLNVTVPVGVPAPGRSTVTVAVNVTDWPKTEGLAEEVSVVAGRRLVDRLAQGGRGAAGEVGVAAVDRGDRVGADASARRW